MVAVGNDEKKRGLETSVFAGSKCEQVELEAALELAGPCDRFLVKKNVEGQSRTVLEVEDGDSLVDRVS
jgi:hypothetical protein